jgi:hypothetical protein
MTSPSLSAPWRPTDRSGLKRLSLALLCLLAVASQSTAQFPHPRPGAYGPGAPSRFDPTSPYSGGGRSGAPGVRLPGDPGSNPTAFPGSPFLPPAPLTAQDAFRSAIGDPTARPWGQPYGPGAWPGRSSSSDPFADQMNRLLHPQQFAPGQPTALRPEVLEALRQVQPQPLPPPPPDLSKLLVQPAMPKFPGDKPPAPAAPGKPPPGWFRWEAAAGVFAVAALLGLLTGLRGRAGGRHA